MRSFALRAVTPCKALSACTPRTCTGRGCLGRWGQHRLYTGTLTRTGNSCARRTLYRRWGRSPRVGCTRIHSTQVTGSHPQETARLAFAGSCLTSARSVGGHAGKRNRARPRTSSAALARGAPQLVRRRRTSARRRDGGKPSASRSSATARASGRRAGPRSPHPVCKLTRLPPHHGLQARRR